MKIVLLGANGQVGWELQRALAPLGELVILARGGASGLCGDLSQTDALVRTLDILSPHVIVNAAAYTAVDKAESEPERARAINTEAPDVLARWAAQHDALLIHYSTDYVFDGSGSEAWTEDNVTAPLSVYGRTKRDGECAVRDSGCRHLLFRTSWVYAARGGNFAKTMLDLARQRDRLQVVADQIGAPTGAELIADVTAHTLRAAVVAPTLSGTYHLAAAGQTSWHDYAAFVFETARNLGVQLKLSELAPILSAAWPTPAQRPLNSRLDTARLRSTFELSLPDWRVGVARMLEETIVMAPDSAK